MNLERIRQRVADGGFKAFAVRHPEWILVGPRSLAVLDKDGEIATLDPLHIVAIKDLRPSKNGASKR